MSGRSPVFRMACAEFFHEKGMLVFYGVVIAVVGVVLPLLMHGIQAALTTAALLTAAFAKPIIADSFAGERERKTLETLLSSPTSGRKIAWAKFRFCLLFEVVFFTLAVMCGVATSAIAGNALTLTIGQGCGIAITAVLNFCAIALGGVYLSAKSGDLTTANRIVSRLTYPLGIVFAAYVSAIALMDVSTALVTTGLFGCFYLGLIIACSAKVARMKQSDYFENIKIKPVRQGSRTALAAPKSQFGVVLGFEFKYLKRLKFLILNFAFLCFCPAIVVVLLTYFTGQFDLTYAVLVTILVIPRVPLNLISYSIGGEKAYRTGESLLSTPLSTGTLFMAKCAVPIILSAVMLLLSSLITLVGAMASERFFPGIAISHSYTTEQIVLLLPVGILSSIAMMFITAVFAVALKTPRQGLYASTAVSILFVVPVIVLVYLSPDTLLWSGIYAAVLLILNLCCAKAISGNVSRPQIMGRL